MPKERKESNIKPSKTLRIYCEGAKTEPNYLKSYIKTLSDPMRKTVISVEKTDKNTPVQLVEVAIREKESSNSLPEDEFWVVYDREAPSKYSNALHSKAMTLATKNGVNVALCNVCFEYWLLLHLVDTSRSYGSYNDLYRKSPLNAEIRKVCGTGYNKASELIFDAIKKDIPLARTRGHKLNKTTLAAAATNKNSSFMVNPYVGIVDLLDAIDAFK